MSNHPNKVKQGNNPTEIKIQLYIIALKFHYSNPESNSFRWLVGRAFMKSFRMTTLD